MCGLLVFPKAYRSICCFLDAEKGSLLALLRKFPEHFRVEERTRTGEVLVRLTTGRTDIPMWL